MKKTNIATIVCAALILLTAAAFILIGMSQGMFDSAAKRDAKITEGLGGESVAAAFSGSGNLTFLENETLADGTVVKVKTDADGNKYRFDNHNHLVQYEYTGETPGRFKNTEGKISEKEARELGRDYAKKAFKEEVKDFTDEELKYFRDSEEYVFTLTRRLGENDFVKGPYCTISMLPSDGSLLSASLSSIYLLDGFDESLLNGVTEQDVAEKVLAQAAAYHPGGNNYQVKSIALTVRNGKYCLEASVEYSMGGGSVLDKEYYTL